METTQSPRILFYAQRSFGEKINASFNFLLENLTPVFKYSTYLLLPFCLIQVAVTIMLSRSSVEMPRNLSMFSREHLSPAFLPYFIVSILCTLICYLLFFALITALIKLYNERKDRLNNLSFRILRPLLFRNMGRIALLTIVLYTLLIILTPIVVLLAIVLTPYSLLFTFPLLMAVAVATRLSFPVYLYEDIGLFKAIGKGFVLGFFTWRGVFATMCVMQIISFISMLILFLPFISAIIWMGKLGYSPDAGFSVIGIIYYFFILLLFIIFIFGLYTLIIFDYLGMSYQYAHAAEKVGQITLVDDIDNFENL